MKLLERIIVASSRPGDMVLDPFCGCATACIAAQQLGRKWVGIDVSPKAAELVELRMRRDLGLEWQGIARQDLPRRTDIGEIPPYASAENRRFLYGKQGGDCAGCRNHFLPRNLTIDHITHRSKGGGGVK